MPLDLPKGSACFVDANIFAYHLVGIRDLGPRCHDFLERVGSEIDATSAAFCLADAVHRVMTIEAREKFQLAGDAPSWLQRHPDRIRELTAFRDAAEQIQSLSLRLIVPDAGTISEAAELSAKHGLLTNDAIIVALMRRHDITHLVTNDDDFDHVPDLTVWKPR